MTSFCSEPSPTLNCNENTTQVDREGTNSFADTVCLKCLLTFFSVFFNVIKMGI